MPVIFRNGGLRCYFFSNEGHPPEPIHIHVRGGGRDAKVWLEPEIAFADSYGFNSRELSLILRVVSDNRGVICELGMSISATSVHFDDATMWVELTDGRTLGVPLAWFPLLLRASSTQRTQVEISRVGLHWDSLDEDISIAGLLAGRGDVTGASTTAT